MVRAQAPNTTLLRRAALGAALLAIGAPAPAADIFKGAETYRQYCAVCHGPDGRSVLVGAPNFAGGERLLRPDLELLASVRAGKGAMPAFQGILSNRQIMDVIAHLRTLQR